MAVLPRVSLNTEMDEGMCFGCGKKNPIGLKMDFTRDGESLKSVFTTCKEHQGWPGIVHGGILTCLLDEAMSNAAYAEGVACLTASMQIRLRQPVKVEVPLVITARVTRKNRRLIETGASIQLEDGTIIAESTAKQFIAEKESADVEKAGKSRSHV